MPPKRRTGFCCFLPNSRGRPSVASPLFEAIRCFSTFMPTIDPPSESPSFTMMAGPGTGSVPSPPQREI